MSRAKIKKKNMFIDMTAMSDVTVLLLTFFMLTASFVKKRACTGCHSCINFRDKDTRNEHHVHSGRSREQNLYES